MTQNKSYPKGNNAVQQLVEDGREPDGLPAITTHTIERDDDLPMRFEGRLISKAGSSRNNSRGTEVSIFVTRRGTIITAIAQWQPGRDRSRAAAHVSGEEALKWLKEDSQGSLGRASLHAWRAACRDWPPLNGLDVEVVE